ncbi:hypothetical protein BCV69DRAFT_243372 [Microstroma glucosiphilum]|uniref:DAGKc domain-containing protein n=1 Tax=Pseudomicrostroma glucosiphilum TaxID=1684307 RepID=A0A316UIU1_9BASI|nr:hypothetical protein BCV69DRAFT_243372 [Pseudomicrostroma glucosiphilum]PWN24261.1 hypothetical protein BCV69DRAFT_243372 [Pseudomicrostroma glucosiphilum]
MTSRNVLIWNPAAGARLAAEILALVRQSLAESGQTFTEYETDAPEHASKIGVELRSQAHGESASEPLTVILLGGDGTTQEFLSGLFESCSDQQQLPDLRIVLVPTGTANALYSALYPPASSSRHEPLEDSTQHGWRLRSLRAYISSLKPAKAEGSFRLYPLTLANTTVHEEDSIPKEVLTHLITSHALHAAILRDSEELRESHPGIERFKMAAQKNVTSWIDGELVLRRAPTAGLPLQKYNPRSRKFDEVEGEGSVVEGPFFYIASMTTDRLEPSFVPAPFGFAEASSSASSSSLARPPQCLDVVLIRPLKDPQVQGESTLQARQTFAEKRVTPITQGMYDEGKHVNLVYPTVEGRLEERIREDVEGVDVIDYWRVGGWEWTPVSGRKGHAVLNIHLRAHTHPRSPSTASRLYSRRSRLSRRRID